MTLAYSSSPCSPFMPTFLFWGSSIQLKKKKKKLLCFTISPPLKIIHCKGKWQTWLSSPVKSTFSLPHGSMTPTNQVIKMISKAMKSKWEKAKTDGFLMGLAEHRSLKVFLAMPGTTLSTGGQGGSSQRDGNTLSSRLPPLFHISPSHQLHTESY